MNLDLCVGGGGGRFWNQRICSNHKNTFGFILRGTVELWDTFGIILGYW